MNGNDETGPTALPGEDLPEAERPSIVLPEGGHCLFTVGAVGAGKSTLQHAVIHRLYTDERLALTMHGEETETLDNQDLQEWIFKFDRGEFPNRTPRGRLQKFYVRFGEHKRKRVELSFMEISGEHFEEIIGGEDRNGHGPRLNDELERVLERTDVQKLFVFVSDATRHGGNADRHRSKEAREQALYEDMLFSHLLQRLGELDLKRIKVLFVAAKWDAASERKTGPRRFFKRHFPGTRAMLKQMHKADVKYIRYSIGKVREEETENEGRRAYIDRRQTEPTERIVQWIHTEATGRRLKGYPSMHLTLWERIKTWVSA